MSVDGVDGREVPNPLGPFRLLHPLGSGGAGTVYLAELEQDLAYAAAGTQLAIKVLDPKCIESETVLRRFLREAELGRLVDHPSVVRTYDIGCTESNGQSVHYLVLEYVEGRTLRELMRELGAFPESLLVDLAKQIAAGLSAIHAAGAAHRDLKPGNILITPDYQVKLMDLGVAFLIESSPRLTREGYFVGTLLYASPEQVRGEEVKAAADLYSAGVLFYESATTVHPFEAGSAQETIHRQLNHHPPKAGDLNPHLSPWLEELIACLMCKKPEERIGSASELVTILDQGEASTWWSQRQLEIEEPGPDRILRQANLSRETSFVGRYRELQTLRALYREARSGHGQVVILEGEAGVGKTRILDELVRELVEQGESLTVLYGSSAPGQLGAAPGPMSRSILDHFGEQNLERRLAPYMFAMPRMLPGFVALLTGKPLPDGATALSGEAVQVVFSFLATVLSADRPMIWAVEDLNFGTAEGVALFAALARQAAELPILWIATTQPGALDEELGALLERGHVHHLEVGRLSRRQVQELLRGLLDSEAAAETVGRKLAARSGGNPLFILEMVRELRERAANQALDAAGDKTEAPVPSSVREILLSRLSDLDTGEQELLEVAAIEGFSFDPDLCAKVVGLKRLEALTRFAALESKGGLVRAAGPRFNFDHHQLQEVLYHGLSSARREELHRSFAQAFAKRRERLATGEEPEGQHHVLLSRHYLLGGAHREGLSHVLAALDHLRERYQTDSVLELADLALEALEPGELALRCDIRLRQTEALEMRGRRELQRRAAEDAVAAARGVGDPVRRVAAELALARYRAAIEDHRGARELLERARRRVESELEGKPGAATLLAEILTALTATLVEIGEFRSALRAGDELLELAQTIRRPQIEARARLSLGRAYLGLGLYERSREHLEPAIRISQAIQERRNEVQASVLLGVSLRSLGCFAEAYQRLEHALNLARTIGFARGALHALCELAALRLDEGRIELAEHHLEGCLNSCRGRQMRQIEGLALLHLGEAHRARHQPGEAERCFEQALELQHSLGVTRALATTSFALGRLLYERGDSERSRPLLEESARLVEDFRLDKPGPLPRLYLRLLDAEKTEAEAINEAEIGEEHPILVRAEAHLLLHRAGAAGDHLQRALSLLGTISAQLHDEARAELWRHNPLARAIRRAGGSRRPSRSAGETESMDPPNQPGEESDC